MLVRVKHMAKDGWFGWYGKKRRRPGDEFEIAGKHELGSWMEPVVKPGRKPKSETEGAE